MWHRDFEIHQRNVQAVGVIESILEGRVSTSNRPPIVWGRVKRHGEAHLVSVYELGNVRITINLGVRDLRIQVLQRKASLVLAWVVDPPIVEEPLTKEPIRGTWQVTSRRMDESASEALEELEAAYAKSEGSHLRSHRGLAVALLKVAYTATPSDEDAETDNA